MLCTRMIVRIVRVCIYYVVLQDLVVVGARKKRLRVSATRPRDDQDKVRRECVCARRVPIFRNRDPTFKLDMS